MKWLKKFFGTRHYPDPPELDLHQLAIHTLTAKGTPHARALAEEIGHNAARPMTDEECLRMFSGARFGPGFQLTLPSGKTITGDEAQVWTSYYDDRERPR